MIDFIRFVFFSRIQKGFGFNIVFAVYILLMISSDFE